MKLLILLAITTLTGVCANHIMQTQNEAMQAQWHLEGHQSGDHNHHGHHHHGHHHHGHHHHGHHHSDEHHSGEHHHGHHHILDIHQISEMLQPYLQQGTQSLGMFYQDLRERLSSLINNAQQTFEEEIVHLSRHINENLVKFRRHSFFHKLSAQVQQRLEAIRHDIAHHLKTLDPRLLQEAVGQRIGELRDQLAHIFKRLLQNKIEYTQEVSEKVMNHLDEFREHWASLVNVYDTVLEQCKKMQEVGITIKRERKGHMKEGSKGDKKGGRKGEVRRSSEQDMRRSGKRHMRRSGKGSGKMSGRGDIKISTKEGMNRRRKENKKGEKKGSKKEDCDESSEENNRRHTQRKVHAWLSAFSKTIDQDSH